MSDDTQPSPAEEKQKTNQPTLKVRVYGKNRGVLEEVDLFGEKIVTPEDFWTTSDGVKILSYEAYKKISEHWGIMLKTDPKVLCSPSEGNNQQHWLGAWFGFSDDGAGLPGQAEGWRYAEGEASRLNTGKLLDGIQGKGKLYMERGCVDAEYRGAMAFKRMFIRGIQTFLHFPDGKVLCEVESPHFAKRFAPPVSTPQKKDKDALTEKVGEEKGGYDQL